MTWDHDAERGYLEGKGAWGEQPDEQPTPNPLDELASMFAPLGAWAADAACAARGVDPTIFDAPDRADRERHTPAALLARQHEAARLCASCPVRRQCQDDAETNDLTGIRGGLLYAGEPTAGRGIKKHDLIGLIEAGLLTSAIGYGGRIPTLPVDTAAA